MLFTARCTSMVGNGRFTHYLENLFPTAQLAMVAALKRFGAHSRDHIVIINLEQDPS